jgi:formylglycine-generating enzyme required for sulfatase activity
MSLVEGKRLLECPEMVVIPAGRFIMGASADEAASGDNERRQHMVKIGRAFVVSKFEITFGQRDECVLLGGCGEQPDRGVGARQPAGDQRQLG